MNEQVRREYDAEGVARIVDIIVDLQLSRDHAWRARCGPDHESALAGFRQDIERYNSLSEEVRQSIISLRPQIRLYEQESRTLSI